MRCVPKMAAAVAIEEPTAIEPRSSALLPLREESVDSHEDEELESDIATRAAATVDADADAGE